MPTALVIGHSAKASLRRLGPWFNGQGLDYELRFGGDGLPDSLDGYAALVVLGGAPLPYEDDKFPWLPATRALTREALDRHIPMLGICLGGQLLAYVGGGTVEHRKFKPEHGITPITLDAAAADDPLFSVLPATFPMTENHVDHITSLPDEAVLLAHSDRSPVQGFRLGPNAWGLQFHPEISAANIAEWDADDIRDVEADGFPWAEVLDRDSRYDEENTRPSELFARRFADIVLGR
ncbi:type 1 glutamine amidotransferase [Bifidobacterium amazonense]|uniref:Type 1 glutamine amidotransferase n=1 Tax=Bifidobacterium amazonense TaxID=2809027 RepID=A0ABS9VWG2_9BIFI|nr:type 1 glutamine amidotransferase [Bifidobacterium amazonense]MCH9276261.1 type 1 glutamine amidotransferase [Bifidobacterium amazonense]